MSYRFRKHYSPDEARALLPEVREWLKQLQQIRRGLQHVDSRLTQILDAGEDVGGSNVNQMVRYVADLNKVLAEFRSREIQIKDIERGLLDFPAIVGGREVFLCWEQDEDDIEFWHELDTGYAGREKL
ncbi:MAG TPA: DUF2203 domain-containing protein [Candidatus Acidoferrum sp.]|nr:DUF2203 domain-containing protein [Candidatus Acidoferrum sp.]